MWLSIILDNLGLILSVFSSAVTVSTLISVLVKFYARSVCTNEKRVRLEKKLAKNIRQAPPDLIIAPTLNAYGIAENIIKYTEKDIPILPVVVQSKIKARDPGVKYTFSTSKFLIKLPAKQDLQNKRVLLIDDVVFTGETMRSIADYWEKVYNLEAADLTTAALIVNAPANIYHWVPTFYGFTNSSLSTKFKYTWRVSG